MPIYSYKCEECEYSCKLFHQIGEEPKNCPSCNSTCFKKQFVGSSIKINNISDDPKSRVERFIEESRQTLKEQIAETRKDYKP